MLFPIAYSFHKVRSAYAIDICMILYLVFKMFSNLKLVTRLYRDNIESKDARIPALNKYKQVSPGCSRDLYFGDLCFLDLCLDSCVNL